MDGQCCAGGVRFRLFPKPPYVHPEWPPETISVSSPPGTIGPGPADDRMRLIFPTDKRYSYGVNPGPLGTPRLDLPPFRGPIHRPVCPDDEGHFDRIPEGTPEFAEAHVFGTVRFVLDIWERYFDRPIEWHFARDYRQLEIVILPNLDNAYAGYGFMEIGAHPAADGMLLPYALNFDVMAHELGHLIIYSTIGVPSPSAQRAEYYGFQEFGRRHDGAHRGAAFRVPGDASARGDARQSLRLQRARPICRIVAARRDPAREQRRQAVAIHRRLGRRARAVAAADRRHFRRRRRHFQELLVERDLIPREIAEATRRVRDEPQIATMVQPAFEAAFASKYDGLRAALIDARDYVGFALAATWQRLKADDFSYLDVAETFIAMDKMMSGGRYRRAVGRELCLAGDWTRDRRPAPQAAGPAQPFLLGAHGGA